MTRAFITGGTGFLGEALARELCARGTDVVAFARAHSPVVAGLPRARMVMGDVLSSEQVAAALAGVDEVYHLAGVVSRDPDDAQRMMRLHVDGTRIVLEQCARASIRRVIVASTSGTVAVSKDDRLSTEDDGYATDIACAWPYYASKIYQEKLAFELAGKLGIEVVVVNPSLLLGPGDRRQSSTGDVSRFLRSRVAFVPAGGINFVDVRDAAAATANAWQKGRAGHRYLLGGPNWTFEQFFARLARVANKQMPRLKVSGSFLRKGAALMEQLARARGREPEVDRISAEMSEHFWYCDSSKAASELGFVCRDPQLTLIDTVRDLQRGL